MPLKRPCSGPERSWLAIWHGFREQSIGRGHIVLLHHAGALTRCRLVVALAASGRAASRVTVRTVRRVVE